MDTSRIQENSPTPKYTELNAEVPSTYAGGFSSPRRAATRSPRFEIIHTATSNGALETRDQGAKGGAHAFELSGSLTQTGRLLLQPNDKRVGGESLELTDASPRKMLRNDKPNISQWRAGSSGFPKKPKDSCRTSIAQSSCTEFRRISLKRARQKLNTDSNRSAQRESEERGSPGSKINYRQIRKRASPKSPKVHLNLDHPFPEETSVMNTEFKNSGPIFLVPDRYEND